jgi:hypothetical protein
MANDNNETFVPVTAENSPDLAKLLVLREYLETEEGKKKWEAASEVAFHNMMDEIRLNLLESILPPYGVKYK